VLVFARVICGGARETGTYHCQSAHNLTRRVDVAVHELADEVCRQANYGDHGDDAEAAGDQEGLCQWSGRSHLC
jgi:hypothetical protein